nr:DUF2946 family protein [Marinomonas hwangdonensis]
MCLFAVVIIYFAPLFAQIGNALSPQPTTSTMALKVTNTAEHHHAKTPLEETSRHHSVIESTHTDHSGHHGHHGTIESINLLEACGYCSLLFHLNWIDSRPFELIPLAQSLYPKVATLATSHKQFIPHTSKHARAPPIIAS